VELALIDVAVAVHLDEMASGGGGRGGTGRGGTDGPEDGGSARAAERER
jgi:hypothetical protein